MKVQAPEVQSKNSERSKEGAVLAETAAALVVLVPLVMLLIYVTVEICICYQTRASLAEAARHAARDLAVQYGIDPAIANNRSLQNLLVFDHVRIPNAVANSNQFEAPVFQHTTIPGSVKVVVRYNGSEGGLPPFPHPDPLNLGSKFVISAESTYRLE